MQFTYRLLKSRAPKEKVHPFDRLCIENNIEHRLTEFRHPWTNGMQASFLIFAIFSYKVDFSLQKSRS